MADPLAELRALRDAETDPARRAQLDALIGRLEAQAAGSSAALRLDGSQTGDVTTGDVVGHDKHEVADQRNAEVREQGQVGNLIQGDVPGASDGGFLGLEGIADNRVLYVARNAASGDAFRLYSVPAAGGASTPLTGDLGTGQELIAVRATAGGNVVFTSGTRLSGPTRWPWLYVVPADGSAAARLVNIAAGPSLFLPLVHR